MDNKFLKRKKRVKVNIFGTKGRPRLSVYRSNKGLYVQIIDDALGKTVVALSIKKLEKEIKGKTKVDAAYLLGEKIAEMAKKKKITKVIFDKSGYKKGKVGVALSKAQDVRSAITKAISAAKRRMDIIPLAGTTIPFSISEKFSAAKVMLKPAPPGSGIIAGGPE